VGVKGHRSHEGEEPPLSCDEGIKEERKEEEEEAVLAHLQADGKRNRAHRKEKRRSEGHRFGGSKAEGGEGEKPGTKGPCEERKRAEAVFVARGWGAFYFVPHPEKPSPSLVDQVA
jgi:hypothetical protein